jgi:hypothetical protein
MQFGLQEGKQAEAALPPLQGQERCACLDAELAWAGVLVGNEVLSHGHKIGEGVLLFEELAVLVPVAAHVAAAAYVRDRECEAAVYQAQLITIEARVI